MQQENLLTSKEAAPILGVSVAFLERDRWAGARVPFIKIVPCSSLSFERSERLYRVLRQTIHYRPVLRCLWTLQYLISAS